jgi:hypothetical protein
MRKKCDLVRIELNKNGLKIDTIDFSEDKDYHICDVTLYAMGYDGELPSNISETLEDIEDIIGADQHYQKYNLVLFKWAKP